MVKGSRIVEISGQLMTGVGDIWADTILPFIKKRWVPILGTIGVIIFILIMIFG